jgi:hypothetical protein
MAAIMAAAAGAHHSFAMWDMQRSIEIHGTIQRFEWTNPHVWIWFVADDEDGQPKWGVEAGAVNSMRQQGWSRNSLQVGDKIIVKLHPQRGYDGHSEPRVGAMESMRRPDGTPIPAGQTGLTSPASVRYGSTGAPAG